MKVFGLKTRKIFYLHALALGIPALQRGIFPWEKKERKYFRKAPPPTGSKQKHALYFSSTLSSWEKNRQTIRDYKLLFYILNIAEQKNKNRRQMLHSRSSDLRSFAKWSPGPDNCRDSASPARWMAVRYRVCVDTGVTRAGWRLCRS